MADDGVDAGQNLAVAMRDLYAAAELELIAAVTAALKSGLTSTSIQWKVEALGKLRNAAQRVVDRLANDGGGLAKQLVEHARKLGSATAYSELLDIARVNPPELAAITRAVPGARAAATIETERFTSSPPRPVPDPPAVEDLPPPRVHAAALPPATPAVNLIEQELASSLRSTEFRILRWAPDVYQRTVAAGAQQLVLGHATPLGAQQGVWDKLSGQGVTGFVDTTGRNWELTSYVEMATRTAAQRAWNEQHTEEFRAADIELVMVSVGHDACQLCRPFQGQILSVGDVPQDSNVDILCSIDDARLDGLQHSNCRCAYVPYADGFTEPPQVKASAQASDERDQQRYLERGVRQWKRRQVAALDEQQQRNAAAKVRVWQSRIRSHVANSSQTRKPHREQIT